MTLRIEAGTTADLGVISSMLDRAGLPTADVGPALLPGFLVARDASGVCGAVAVETLGPMALLRSLVVAPEARSKGIGARLVRAAEDLAADRGLAPVYLLTTTADGYFQRRGYRPVSSETLPPEVRNSREFQVLCPDTAIVLAKP